MAGRIRRKDSPHYDFTPVDFVACGGQADDHPDAWDRTEAGDVINGLAFRAHMDRVGEEDQSIPGWDGP